MDFHDFDCPIRYPNKCNLIEEEYEPLIDPNRWVVFLMYQFKDNEDTMKEVRKFFKKDKFHNLDAKKEPTMGVKFCKICRLALASDFGVALLSPLNFNVFLEVGLMLGMQKPILFLNNPKVVPFQKLPFDLTHEMTVEFANIKELREGLKNETPSFLIKVGKTEERRELRNALKNALAEIRLNAKSEPNIGVIYQTVQLAKLLQTKDIPIRIDEIGQTLLNLTNKVNTVLAAVAMGRKITSQSRWNQIKKEYSIKSLHLEALIEEYLAYMVVMKRSPFGRTTPKQI